MKLNIQKCKSIDNNYVLSIIIPVYNGEPYLKECLDSIFNRNQDNTSFEIIIIDDGSKDNSFEIAKNYAKKYKNIKLIKNTNHGVSYSRNCGIDNAKGKYITFVDCDDILDDNWFETISEQLCNEYDILFYSKYFINDKEKDININRLISYILTYNNDNIRISGPYSKLFNRRFLIENNIKFKTNIINGEDTLFNIESAIKGHKFLLLKKSFYIVRHNKFSSTSKFNPKIISSEKDFNLEMIKLITKNKTIDKEYVTKACFLTSIRSLAYKLSYISNYKTALKHYQEISDDSFFSNNFKKMIIKNNLKSEILFFLFKNKMYKVLFFICKRKNMKNKEDFFELL